MHIYLIQRGLIKRPLADKSERLSQAVALDYMGSAEFEFGALPRSFREIEANADRFVQRLVPTIKQGESALRIWSYLSDEEFAEYVAQLTIMRDPKTYHKCNTKESTRFNANYSSEYNNTDFWWDIKNHVMFGFDKNFMNRVGEYTANSLMYMNE